MTTDRLDPEVKAAWLKALRSGDYKQGHGVLRTHDNKYCCLGVMCDLDPNVKWQHDDGTWYAEQGLSSSCSIYPGRFPGNTSIVIGGYLRDEGFEDVTLVSLAELNDSGMTFDQIADVIDYAL